MALILSYFHFDLSCTHVYLNQYRLLLNSSILHISLSYLHFPLFPSLPSSPPTLPLLLLSPHLSSLFLLSALQLNAIWDSVLHLCYGLLECPHCKRDVGIVMHMARDCDSLAGKACRNVFNNGPLSNCPNYGMHSGLHGLQISGAAITVRKRPRDIILMSATIRLLCVHLIYAFSLLQQQQKKFKSWMSVH